jgi:hypothetical protein
LPKCGPCARTESACEYYDKQNGQIRNRNYIVYLQLKVRELEDELERAVELDLSAPKETVKEEVATVAPTTPVATGEQILVDNEHTITTDQVAVPGNEPMSKKCVLCRQVVTYSNKSELRYASCRFLSVKSLDRLLVPGNTISRIFNHTYVYMKNVPQEMFDTRHSRYGLRISADFMDKYGYAYLDATSHSTEGRLSSNT